MNYTYANVKCPLARTHCLIFNYVLLALTGSPRPHGFSFSSLSAMRVISAAIQSINVITRAAITPTIRAVTNTVFIIVGLLSFSLIR